MKLVQKVTAVKEPKSYGHITLNSSDFPEVANLKLGDKQTFEITVDVTALRKPDSWEVSNNKVKPSDVIASIRVTNVKIEKEDSKKEM